MKTDDKTPGKAGALGDDRRNRDAMSPFTRLITPFALALVLITGQALAAGGDNDPTPAKKVDPNYTKAQQMIDDGQYAGAGSAKRSRHGMGRHDGIAVDIRRLSALREIHHASDMGRLVHPCQLLETGQGGVMVLHDIVDARGNQLIVDGKQSRGLVRMLGTGVMVQAVGM